MADTRKKEKKCPMVPAWMTTFTDMTTLLLTFFILMFTVAEIDGHELKLILSSFTGSFGIMEGGLTLQKGPLAQMGMTVERLPSTKSQNNLAKAFKDGKETMKKEKQVKVAETHRGLVISVPGNTFFDPDEYRLKPEGRRLLEKVAIFLLNMKAKEQVDNQVEIEAHASLEPESVSDKRLGISDIWLKNLDLTTNRAKEVEKFLINEFMRRKSRPIIKRNGRQYAKFVAKGYGEFQPLESNDTPQQRAANRRVDIVIKRD